MLQGKFPLKGKDMVEVNLDLWNRMLSEIPLKWMHITSKYTAIYMRTDDKTVFLGKIKTANTIWIRFY